MLHSLYAISDLCVIPSLYEPFGLVALEAMASGCPCIVADTGGLREVVPGGERVGLRFRASDSASLATMMEKVLSDDVLRDRLVAEASEHILRFDWADVARAAPAEVYAELLAAGRHAAYSPEHLRGLGHQRAGGRLALRRVLGQRAADDLVDRERQVRPLLARPRRRLGEVRVHDRRVGVARERHRAGEALVEHRAERVDVGGGGRRLAADLLRARSSRSCRRTRPRA